MKTFFLDTGYIIALEASDDQHHESAIRHWRSLPESLPFLLVTTSYVFDEIVTFFNSRNRHDKAVEIGEYLINSPSVRFVYADESLFHKTWQYFRQRGDKRYSLTDCMSFVVMEQFGIREALTFDKHFVQAGFTKIP